MKHRNGNKDGRDCQPAKPVSHKAVPVKTALFAKVPSTGEEAREEMLVCSIRIETVPLEPIRLHASLPG